MFTSQMQHVDAITISRTPSGARVVEAHYSIFKKMQAKTTDTKRKVIFQMSYNAQKKSEVFKIEAEYLVMLENLLREEEKNRAIIEGQMSIFDILPF